jgi:hypothetical protein
VRFGWRELQRRCGLSSSAGLRDPDGRDGTRLLQPDLLTIPATFAEIENLCAVFLLAILKSP